MTGYVTNLSTEHGRARAKAWIDKAPKDWLCEVREPRRTNAQNDRMWLLLSRVAVAKPGGRSLEPRKWKNLFMDALEKELNDAAFGSQWEPGLNGEGVVNLGHRSSRLNKAQMSELLEFIEAWAAEQGIFLDEQEAA